jgi:ketosteroid isomerase-like protein
MIQRTIATALLSFLFLPFASFAQAPEMKPLALAARRQIADVVAYIFETSYVSPEKGKKTADEIRAAREKGIYDSAETVSAMAEMLNRQLAPLDDRHVGVRVNLGALDAPPLTIENWKARSAERRSPNREIDNEQMRLVNYGIRGVQSLDGNIGYLDISAFWQGDAARAAADSAMTLLSGSDAIIIDLRQCPGGSGDQVSYLASYFFGPEPRVLMNRYNRPMDRRMDSTTTEVRGKRMPDVDLYLLIGPSTASACESFPFTLQQYGRAKTVGQRTAGAGNNNAIVQLGYGLQLSFSVGTATHPKTGKVFEAVGVHPDIEVATDRALDTARAEALKGIIARTTDERRKRELSIMQMVAGASTRAAAQGDSIEQVKRLEREWLDAYEKRDSATMQRIVADDFAIVFPDGSSQTKAEILNALERGRASGRKSPAFRTEDVQARAYGDAVVLSGRVITEMPRPDGTPTREVSRYTDTYARRNGRWQVVSSHLSNAGSASSTPTAAVSAPTPAPTPLAAEGPVRRMMRAPSDAPMPADGSAPASGGPMRRVMRAPDGAPSAQSAPAPAATGTAADALADYVGTYGNKEISIRDGGLHYQRIGGAGAMLTPIERDTFALRTDAVIRFLRDGSGRVTTMRIEWVDRPVDEIQRQ